MLAPKSIAVVVPVRDRPILLLRALHSVLAQTFRPAAVIVVLDAPGGRKSEDAHAARSLEASFERLAIPLVLVEGETRGPAAARNAGVRATDHDWIAFLDSDDAWHANKLARQADYLARRPHLVACQTRERWFRFDRELAQPERLRPRRGRFLRDALHTCLVACSSVVIRRDAFWEVGGFDESYPACEDFELWLRLLEVQALGLVEEKLSDKHSGDWPQLSSSPLLDQLRIRAVLSAVDRGRLGAEERAAARASCLAKLSVLERGADKHGSRRMVEEVRAEIRRRFSE